jgi:tripartite-type tricarboxylate transporter receptor subunit TctC
MTLSVRSTTLLLAGLVIASAAQAADPFPSKPVTLMVPYPAGGLSDLIARKVNGALSATLMQPVIIENLGGASGAIAAQKVLNAPADGYYLFQGSPNELILAPMVNAAIKFKTEDFRLVQRIAVSPLAVVARKDLPAANADELATYAVKVARDGKPMTYASVGVGSFYHLLGAHMANTLGTTMTHVPYKGGGPILTDLLGGQIDIFITPYGAPHVEMDKQGKIKFVAALSAERQGLIKNVPAVDEGKMLKGFHYTIGTGYFVKKDTPEPIVIALHKALTHVLSDPDLQATLAAQGMQTSAPLSLEAAAQAYATEAAQYRAIAKSIKLEAQ